MSKPTGGLPEWANLLLKVLVIMIFPLNVQCNNFLQLIILPANGLLFTPVQYYPDLLTDFIHFGVLLGAVLRNFIIGIIIAFPGIFYTYKLSRVPVSRSYWTRGLGTAIAIYFLTIGFLFVLLFGMYTPIGFMTYNIYLLYERLVQYTTLVMGVFIVLPLIQRQAVIIRSPSDLHDYSMREIELFSKLDLSREKILSAIFWLVLCFAPIAIYLGPYYGNCSALMMNYMIGFNLTRYINMASFYFRYYPLDFSHIPFYALMSLFNFIFVRDSYRYLRNEITRKRLLWMAVISTLFPTIITLAMYTSSIFYLLVLPIPIPIIQFVGLLIVKLHRPLADQTGKIWMGEKSKMWWESDDEAENGESTSEKPRHRRDDTVIVSLDYLLISRIRQLKHRLRR